MRTGKTLHINFCFKDLQRSLLIRWLYLFHWLTGRRLQLSFISKPDAVVFSDGSLTLNWQVSGCHQIKINDTIVLPGNSSSVQLKPMHLHGPLRLRFYGCRQTIEKTYNIKPVSLHTKQLTHIVMHDPTFYTKEFCLRWNFSLLTAKLIKMHLSPVIFSAEPSFREERCPSAMRAPTLRVQLDACKLPHYNP